MSWNAREKQVLNELEKVIKALPKKNKYNPKDIAIITNIENEVVYVTYEMIDNKVVLFDGGKVIWNKNK